MRIITLIFLFSLPLYASDNTIEVMGECESEVETDRISIVLNVQTRDKDIKKAVEQTSKIYNDLKKRVKKMKLKSLTLSNTDYRVFEKKEWRKGTQVSKGYVAKLGLKVVTSQVKRAGEIISLAGKMKLESVGNLVSFISRDKYQREVLNCLAAATKNAKTKADKIAGTLKVSVGKIVQLQEFVPEVFHRPYEKSGARMKLMDSSAAGSSGTPQLEVGKQTIRAKVKAKFILNK